jgi:hypothetical protein
LSAFVAVGFKLTNPLQQKAGELFGRGKLGQNFAEPIAEGEALELFAEKVGSNKETVRQALYLIEHAPPEELTTRNPRSMPRPREIVGMVLLVNRKWK